MGQETLRLVDAGAAPIFSPAPTSDYEEPAIHQKIFSAASKIILGTAVTSLKYGAILGAGAYFSGRMINSVLEESNDPILNNFYNEEYPLILLNIIGEGALVGGAIAGFSNALTHCNQYRISVSEFTRNLF